MFRKAVSIPAAALLVLGGVGGLGRQGGIAQAHVAQDTYAGTIAFTDNVFPDGLPFGNAYGNNTTVHEVFAMMSDGLLNFDNHQQFYPDLATEVPSTANGGIKVVNGHEVVTVHLKPSQRWSDGSPITNEDYVANMLLFFAPEVNNTLGLDEVQTITFSGNDMVITYKGLDAPALSYGLPAPFPFEYFNKKYHTTVPASLMASYDASKLPTIFGSSYKGSELQKMVNAWNSDAYDSPSDVFNGPYKLAEWTDQQRITLVPNTYYTALPADKNHPRPAKIQFVVITLNGTAYPLDMTANSTYDNIDLAEDFRLTDLPTLNKSKFVITIRPALSFHHLEFNQAVPALRDVRVRQALQLAINKDQYIRALVPALSAAQARLIAAPSILPTNNPWFDKSLPINPYDPAKARALLAAAGYATSPGGPGKHLSLTYTAFSNAINIRSSQLLQRYWAQIGVQVALIYVPTSGPNGLLSSYQDGGIIQRRKFQIIEFGLSSFPDPDQTIANVDPAQIPDASHPQGANNAGITDARFANLFLQARHTLDDAQRHRYYNQAQELMFQQAYWVPLYITPNVSLTKGTIGNFKPNPTQAQNEWNAFEWYRTTGATPSE
jgi:ABC-type transport system substrate-binding protein